MPAGRACAPGCKCAAGGGCTRACAGMPAACAVLRTRAGAVTGPCGTRTHDHFLNSAPGARTLRYRTLLPQFGRCLASMGRARRAEGPPPALAGYGCGDAYSPPRARVPCPHTRLVYASTRVLWSAATPQVLASDGGLIQGRRGGGAQGQHCTHSQLCASPTSWPY